MGLSKKRNDLCWCDSGKKRKKCHGVHRPKLWQIDKVLDIKLRKASNCLAPDELKSDCSGKIVRAHTVSRSSSLSAVSEDGHVLTFHKPSLQSLDKTGGFAKLKRVGVKQASTFAGFCSKHDNDLFLPIEGSLKFTATPEQCFLLAYRAFARECFTKRSLLESLSLQRNLAEEFLSQQEFEMFLPHLERFKKGTQIGVNDNARIKAMLDSCLISKEYSILTSYVIKFKEVQPIMCSASFFPVIDFSGNRLQDLDDPSLEPEAMYVNSIFDGSDGFLVLTWDGGSEKMNAFARSLSRFPLERTTAIVCFLFDHFENLCIRQSWWDSLDKRSRDLLEYKFNKLASPNSYQTDFFNSGIYVNEWKIVDSWFTH